VTAARTSLPSLPRRRWLIGSLVAIVLLTGTFLGSRWLIAYLDRRQGLWLAGQQRFAEAEPLLQSALNRRPDDVEVLQNLAQVQLAQGKLEGALGSFNTWCRLSPNDPKAYQQRLALHVRQENIRLALEDARRVSEIEPEDYQARTRLAQLLASTGKYAEAEQECRRCLQREPQDPVMRSVLATVLHERGDNAAAIALLDPLLSEFPRLTPAVLTRALIYDEAGQWDQAITLFRRVRELDTGAQQLAASYHLGLALARNGQEDEARQLLAEVKWRKRVEDLIRIERIDDAIDVLREVLANDPQAVAAHRLLATCYEKRGDMQQAKEHQRLANKQ
jgi:tetratricopeptide (TPR) repeat protein